MSLKYSFSGIPIINILKLIPSIIPGLEKILSVYYCVDTAGLRAMLINDTDENEIEEISIPERSFFDELRKKKHTFSWHNKDELPFHIPKSIDKQIDMFVFKDIVLLIRVLSPGDNLNDLLFLYFKENVNYFGIRKSNKAIDPENKIIIGNILYNTINTIYKKDAADTTVFIEDKVVMQSILKRSRNQRKEYNNTLEMYGQSIINLFEKYLLEISRRKSIDFILTEGAKKEIKNYSGDISKLKQIVGQAALEAETINMDENVKQIKIDECFIDLDQNEEDLTLASDIPSMRENRYYKTRVLLDKLEGAVLKLKNENLKITGTNVGKACPVAISAPAISDALKKHRKRIIQLMQDNPDNWLLLRKEFRPLKNILVTQISISA
ncbi:MAG: hypothetical protein K8S00_13860 [Bacteroidales bacterium]|nr:hypothetical protein [Bacteroidales bacterium]